MSVHLLNSRPETFDFEGQKWFPASYVLELEDALREKMRDASDLRGYMATINELFQSLPERLERAPYAKSADTFRKHALIKTGYCDVDTIVFEHSDQAARMAATIGYRARMGYGYALTLVRENMVLCSVPHSQSIKAMGRETFNKSRGDVLDYCRGVVGVSQ